MQPVTAFNASARPRFSWRRAAQQFLLFWAVYTLSIGPMYWTWFDAAYVDGSYWIAAFYAPLQFACEYVPLYGDLVEGYIWWWNFPPLGESPDLPRQLVAG